MPNVEDCALPDVKLITPTRHGDHRGFFSETLVAPPLPKWESTSISCRTTIRVRPRSARCAWTALPVASCAQDKLVRVTRGRILDVAVDIRTASPTFGKHVAVELSAANWKQLLVPVGFAHGFVTLEPDTEVQYKVSAPYSPENDHGLAFDDPALGIDWACRRRRWTLFDKDRKHPRLAEMLRYFD